MSEKELSFEESREIALDAIRGLGTGFTKPDDDWFPVAMAVKGDGQIAFAALAVDKHRFPEVLRHLRKEFEAKFIGIVVSAWGVVVEPGEDPLGMRPLEHPRRKELLFFDCSDGKHFEVWNAEIVRHEDSPPGLGKWEKWPTEAKTEMAGPLSAMSLQAFAGDEAAHD